MESGCQFTPFEVGQIKAHVHHGLGPTAIADLVVKPDGVSYWSKQAIADVINKLKENPSWKGERQDGSGRLRVTTKAQDKKVIKEVFKKRGSVKVTVAYLKKKFEHLRNVGDSTVERRLHEANLVWLRRRRKTLVASTYLEPRIQFAKMVRNLRATTLHKWAYTDGTVFYLDKTAEMLEHTQRLALGSHVWRMCDGKDALWKDTIGPSSYAKAQGKPVKIWGMLSEGTLKIRILPEGDHMNRWWYAWIVTYCFPQWLGNCKYSVAAKELKNLSPEQFHQYVAWVASEQTYWLRTCCQAVPAVGMIWGEPVCLNNTY